MDTTDTEKNKQKKLTGEQVSRLESIGMIWDGEAKQRERTYQAALTYYREHGDLKIPANYVDANGLHLGWWVRGVRRAYQRGTLDKEQIERLEGIGMEYVRPKWKIHSGQALKDTERFLV